MKSRLSDDSLHSTLIDSFIAKGVKGGQNSDGSQKPGILLYEKGKPVSVYDPGKNDYVRIESFRSSVDDKLGKLPPSHKPWKDVIGDRQKDEFLKKYFSELKVSASRGSKLAADF